MIKIAYSASTQEADLVRNAYTYQTESGLESLALATLYTYARALDSDVLPPGADRGGWWGDSFGDEGEGFGSRLWLLRGASINPATLKRAEEIVREAFQFWIDRGIASDILVEAEQYGHNAVSIRVGIQRPSALAPQWFGPWEIQLS